MMQYDKDIEEFSVHMKHKLLVHKAKGGTERLGADELLKLLLDEVKELQEALEDGKKKDVVISECADVANMAMFITTKLKGQL